MGNVPVTGKYCCPLPAGFPQNRSPLKGNPPFWGKPSALGHEGYRGRRLCGAAMLCRLQCARFAKRMAHCRRTLRLALGTHFVAADLQERAQMPAVQVWLGGSTPNKFTSCSRTPRRSSREVQYTPNKCTWGSSTLRIGSREVQYTPNKCTWESGTLRKSVRGSQAHSK